MTSAFFASRSSTSQLADMYRPLKKRAYGEARYTATPAASSTADPTTGYVSTAVVFGVGKSKRADGGLGINIPVSSQKWRTSGCSYAISVFVIAGL